MVTAPSGSFQWLYLIDTKSHAFAIYRLDPSTQRFVQLNDHLLPALGGDEGNALLADFGRCHPSPRIRFAASSTAWC